MRIPFAISWIIANWHDIVDLFVVVVALARALILALRYGRFDGPTIARVLVILKWLALHIPAEPPILNSTPMKNSEVAPSSPAPVATDAGGAASPIRGIPQLKTEDH